MAATNKTATGLIGSALTEALSTEGHEVYPLVRNEHTSEPFYWQPEKTLFTWMMLQFLLVDKSITSPVNLVLRTPVTNREFTRALGSALHRPTLFPLPAFVARIMFGEMANALLMSSARILPTRLQTAGYQFKDQGLEAIKSLLDN